MKKIFFITFIIFLINSITSTAFEDKKTKDLNFIYKLNAELDDLVLNYCSTYDSYTINRLYSEKKIQLLNFNKKHRLNNFVKSFDQNDITV